MNVKYQTQLWIRDASQDCHTESHSTLIEDRFLRGRQIAYPIYEYFRVTGANDSVENYADLFTVVLRNDDIQEFDSKWDGTLQPM